MASLTPAQKRTLARLTGAWGTLTPKQRAVVGGFKTGYTDVPGKRIPTPARPPTGYYDPAIDAQVQAGARGLGDLRIDTATGKRRGTEDLQTTLADLLTGETRTRADYDTATGNLGRNYGILATGQAQGARQHGVLSGGLAQEAAGIRGVNQAREQGQLDTSLTRAMEDFGRRRAGAQTTFDRQYGPGGDLDLTLARGEREQPFLESDANDQRLFQAKQAGYIPPPKWRFGKPRRLGVRNGRGLG